MDLVEFEAERIPDFMDMVGLDPDYSLAGGRGRLPIPILCATNSGFKRATLRLASGARISFCTHVYVSCLVVGFDAPQGVCFAHGFTLE